MALLWAASARLAIRDTPQKLTFSTAFAILSSKGDGRCAGDGGAGAPAAAGCVYPPQRWRSEGVYLCRLRPAEPAGSERAAEDRGGQCSRICGGKSRKRGQ